MDSTTETVSNALVSLLMASPALLVALVGCVLVLLRRRRHPKASVLALVGLLIYLANSFLFPVIYAVLPSYLAQQGWSLYTYTIIYRSLAMIQSLAGAAALALLLAAVLVGRGAPPHNAERNYAR